MLSSKQSSDIMPEKRNPWAWIPSLYFSAGFPYLIVISVSVFMYRRFGLSNGEIAFYTSWLYLPWVLKPFWSPLVDLLRTKRYWIYLMEFIIGIGFAGVALTIPLPDFFQFTLAFFWIVAFAAATHETAADGFYLHGLSKNEQAFYSGIRGVFYKAALIAGQGGVILLCGLLESTISVAPAQIKIVVKPNVSYLQSAANDTILPKPLPGRMRVVPDRDYFEISPDMKTTDEVSSFVGFIHNLNIMNGFSREQVSVDENNSNKELTGNYVPIKLHLSKPPGKDEEYVVTLDFVDGDEGIKVIEGKSFRFNENNWNRPAIAVIQLDAGVLKNSETIFSAGSENKSIAWMLVFSIIGGVFVGFSIYHRIILPDPVSDISVLANGYGSFFKEYFKTIFRFFEKRKIGFILLFLLFFRFSEAQLVKIEIPFLMDSKEAGGLGLSMTDIGFATGIVGLIALLAGGILGGILISKSGLKKMLWPLFIAANIPQLVFIYLAFALPSNKWVIFSAIGAEQFFSGLGFSAYLVYMFRIANGDFRTSHFAFAVGFMTLGMMIPGMVSGFIQEAIGYRYFFIWLAISAIPAYFITRVIRKRGYGL